MLAARQMQPACPHDGVSLPVLNGAMQPSQQSLSPQLGLNTFSARPMSSRSIIRARSTSPLSSLLLFRLLRGPALADTVSADARLANPMEDFGSAFTRPAVSHELVVDARALFQRVRCPVLTRAIQGLNQDIFEELASELPSVKLEVSGTADVVEGD